MAAYMCLGNCIHGRNDKTDKDMIRCCICAQWYHLDCVKLPSSEASGVWSCLECRQMPSMVKTLVTNVNSLASTLSQTLTKLDKAETDRKQERDELLKDNVALRDNIASLMDQMSKASWRSFRNSTDTITPAAPVAPTTDRILLGSSLIRSMMKVNWQVPKLCVDQELR